MGMIKLTIEEINYITEVIEKLKSIRETIAKFEQEKIDNPDYLKNPKIKETIDNDIFVERGRLLNYYKNNKDRLDALYNKYDLFMNINNTLNKEENELYTIHDKILEIKNFIINNEYINQEYELIDLIDKHLENIDEFKIKFHTYGDSNGLNSLASAKEIYIEELKKHKGNIEERYSNEFIHRKTKLISSWFTMLPKAVGLAIEKVKTCIKEKKEAKENLAIINKKKKVLKAIGQVVATPFVYAGKYVIDHWYLLLLLFSRKDKLLRRKDKKEKADKEQDNDKNEQEQEVYVFETEKEKELAEEKIKIPGTISVPKPAFVKELSITKERDMPSLENGNGPINQEAIKEFAKGQGIQITGVEQPVIPIKNPFRRPLNIPDPLIEGKKEIVMPSLENGNGPIDIERIKKFANERAKQIDLKPIPVEETLIEIKKEELKAIDSTCKNFISYLEDRTEYNFFVASNHNIPIVHSKEEFASLAGCPIDSAERIYQSTIAMGIKASDRQVIWPEMEENLHFFENELDLANHIQSGNDENLKNVYENYSNMYAREIENAVSNVPLG